ncbi:hypothetical protein JXL19_11335 [bacterium]|nr:hypothetical protein [bacterium]
MYYEHGMTILEIAVAASIISLIIALAIPGIITILPRLNLNSQTAILQGDLQEARLKAVSLNTFYRMSFILASDPDTDFYKGEFYDPNISSWENDPDIGLQRIKKDVDIKFINSPSNSTGSYSIEFKPDGTSSFASTNTNANIYISNIKGSKKKISILSSTGFIQVTDGW